MSTTHGARVIWHRRDLRLTDNVLYTGASTRPATTVIPLYVFDPKDFSPQRSSSDASHAVARVGPFATRFLLESVQGLRKSLQALGVDLFLRVGEPRHVVPAFIQELQAAGLQGPIEVVWHDEAGTSEAAEAVAVRAALLDSKQGTNGVSRITCSSFWGGTLWHPLDLTLYKRPQCKGGGQEVDLSPECWAQIKQQGVQSFRRKAQASGIRPPQPSPTALPAFPVTGISPGDLPTLGDLLKPVAVFGFTEEEVREIIVAAQGDFDSRSAHPFHGGEAAGLEHLTAFVKGPAEDCDRTGGGDAGGGVYSSAKVSAYLAFGCLSPRTVHSVCKARQDGKAMWLPENMEMRDFWIFYALAHGRHLFTRDGDGPANLPANHWREHNPTVWRRWLLGTTGLPLLDAAMQELRATGYTSNRCRQIPVSVLANDLRIDWRSGAELYQWLLVDHDVGPNWGNWRYFAGVGCDPKKRYYKALSQGLRYDTEASFIKTWLPQLGCLSAREAHLIPVQRARSVVADEIKWPEPVVDALKQLSWEDQKGLGRPTPSTYESEARAVPGKGKGKGKGGKGKRQAPSHDVIQATDTGPSGSKVRRWHAKGGYPDRAMGA